MSDIVAGLKLVHSKQKQQRQQLRDFPGLCPVLLLLSLVSLL